MKCRNCFNEFVPDKPSRKYCSWECYLNSRKLEEVNCFFCGKNFTPKRRKKEGSRYFCSRSCAGKSNIKRVKCKCSNCGEIFTLRPSEAKGKNNVYCSRSCKDEGHGKIYRGENHPRYNPEMTLKERVEGRKYFEYYVWRNKVYERDDYTCLKCGDSRGGNLVAHHILNYSEHPHLRTELSNGVTLCNSCHKDFHDTFGYNGNNLEQLKTYLK